MDDTTKHQPCYSDITACLNDYQWKSTNITMVNGDTYLLFLFTINDEHYRIIEKQML